MTTDIDQIKFSGLLANSEWDQITGPEFEAGLRRVGWKSAGHIFTRLRTRGPRMGMRTPAEFARRLHDGRTELEGNGRARRYLGEGTNYVAYRVADRAFITLRDR